MSFDIPGYFLDKKTNKLFKITPHGPYSLPELRKRLQKEEEEAKAAAIAAAAHKNNMNNKVSLYYSQRRRRQWPTTINQYLRQRAAFGSLKPSMDGITFLMSLLKPRSSIRLDGPNKRIYSNMCVEMTNGSEEYGEIFIAGRSGLHHFGYELDPRFHVWKVSDDYYNGNEIQALQLGQRTQNDGERNFRDLVGTTGNFIWRHAFPVLPPLLDEEIRHMFLTEDESIQDYENILSCPSSYVGFCESYRRGSFRQRKDLFWSFSLNDEFDSLVIGGDQNLYYLNSAFELIHSRRVKSSIFATHIPKTQPNICWTGSRNGKISLMDWRQNKSSPYYSSDRCLQSSSVVKLQTLDGHSHTGFELLAVGLDGSINIWDTRKPKNSSHSTVDSKRKNKGYYHHSNYYQKPISILNGHVNESNHYLGFDVDLQNDLLMAAGSDGHVRIWSLKNSNANDPIWTSCKYASPIPAVKFMCNSQTYPRLQDGWTSLFPKGLLSRRCPGVLFFGTDKEDNEQCSIEWLTSMK
ncbi:uncharacterized protein BX663DRAFT_543900 [Cokeromyces recurvatus]|uniref:uncharacterized protein n=1 Tax=Cokeromyces recurvatus TaxID=90255 RepID=UPI002220D63A|nr:uncharacterized protein BX663DRAFT_543900 [Cokeromyces recurvatus]KAI7902004.1 hypothetical protein BX663DRAFT_543900 [Cokeromyces recurvatus]